MTRASRRRITGIKNSMMGKAIIQEAIHDSIHFAIMPLANPMARMVATPETKNVMMNVRANGRAKCIVRAGSFFTAAGTIWYGQ